MLKWTLAPLGNNPQYYYSDIMDFIAVASELGNNMVFQFLQDNWGHLSLRYQRLNFFFFLNHHNT